MPREYELMIYFAVATIHFYRNSIVAVRGTQSSEDFAKRNAGVIKRVGEEAMNLFNYELSHEQMMRAVAAYQAPGHIIATTTPATRP